MKLILQKDGAASIPIRCSISLQSIFGSLNHGNSPGCHLRNIVKIDHDCISKDSITSISKYEEFDTVEAEQFSTAN